MSEPRDTLYWLAFVKQGEMARMSREQAEDMADAAMEDNELPPKFWVERAREELNDV